MMMADAEDSGVSLPILDQSSLSESPPLVFQCSQCNNVVGDSLSWVSADKIMRTITLSRVSSKVGVRPEISVVSNGRDQGSTYNALYCLQCNETLGKKYIASSPEIDMLRGYFSLDAEKLESYKLGECEKNNNTLADMVSSPNPIEVWRQVSKIKYLLVSMNERLSDVEKKLKLHGDGREATPGDGDRIRDLKTANTDHIDTESVTSTENMSSKSSYCRDADVHVTNHVRGKENDGSDVQQTVPCCADSRQGQRTPFSPRRASHSSRHRNGMGDHELSVPLSDSENRHLKGRRRLANSCKLQRLTDDESEINVEEYDSEHESRSRRMEQWPLDEHVEVTKKRKRIN